MRVLVDLPDTAPAEPIGPYPQWYDARKIVSLDPWGHMVGEAFGDLLKQGWDIRPTIAVTKARIEQKRFAYLAIPLAPPHA